MRIEKVHIEIDKIYNSAGEHTCVNNIKKRKETCYFYGTKRFGTIELCLYGDVVVLERQDEVGFLIPQENCPLREKGE